MRYNNYLILCLVPALTNAIRNADGLQTEGIFRISTSGEKLKKLKMKLEESLDYAAALQDLQDPHVPAALLKAWFRDLVTPLFPQNMYSKCVEMGVSARQSSESFAKTVQPVLNSMSPVSRHTLFHLHSFLGEIRKPDNLLVNRMTAQNLAVVFAPNLIRSDQLDPMQIIQDSKHCNSFLEKLLSINLAELMPEEVELERIRSGLMHLQH